MLTGASAHVHRHQRLIEAYTDTHKPKSWLSNFRKPLNTLAIFSVLFHSLHLHEIPAADVYTEIVLWIHGLVRQYMHTRAIL